MIGMGAKFDPETWAKAKPEFIAAAGRFSEFAHDIGELFRRMMGHMRDVLKWPAKVMDAMRPYFKRFFEELQQGIIRLGNEPIEEKPAQPKRASAKPEQETENQVTYRPKSDVPGLGTLVPVNMRRSIADSLDALEKRVGNIDDFVANELGYDKPELQDYFGAEQVDALGLAIDNIKRGKGFIIGDQTGVGKGRVNAAIIRWAIKNNRVPIFVTQTPTLFTDMYRDLQDIGISDGFLDGAPRVFATNTGLKLPLDDAGKVKIANGDAKSHAALMQDVTDPEAFWKKYDMVFTTYAQMQTVKGEDTARREFLRRLAPNAVAIFDESHSAGGQKLARAPKKGTPVNRSGFTRDLVANANGVFYSSATYAKRPDVMDLYAATDMAMAVDNLEDLGEAIASGGVPMQQVVAAMLAEGGQYIRRERSFAGVTYDTPLVAVDKSNYAGISHSLDLIQKFSLRVKDVAGAIAEEVKKEAGAMGHDNATGGAGADSVNFTSIMHNVINQMLLALKAKPAADMAIEALKRGEKPVLTVANTMEAFLKDYAETLELKPGDKMPADFSDVLQKYLDRTRTITIKKPFSKKGDNEKKYLTDAELGPFGAEAYREAKDIISRLELSGLPISPIDYLKNQLERAGFKATEITGRQRAVDYSGDVPALTMRPGADTTIKGRNEARAKFNNGELDAMILNQAGSTGISLHASEKFKDQRRRHMIIVQPEANIDTHMQMLGRVHRTGQIVTPVYSQMVADIPAEKRPAAVLAKKMASLNANTTAARGSALTAKDVPDFINDYGDAIAVSYLQDNPEMNARLYSPVKVNENGAFERPDAMRKLTGRIPLLPPDKQEEVYEHLESEYDALLKQMDAAGENILEAKTLNMKARTLETSEVVPAKPGSNSPFAAPVNIEKVSIARLGKPFTPEEVVKKVLTEIGADEDKIANVKPDTAHLILEQLESPYQPLGRQAANHSVNAQKEPIENFKSYLRSVVDDLETPERQDKERTKLNAVMDRWLEMHRLLRTGQRVTLKTSNGNITGVVLSVEQKGKPKNPLALSTWKAHFAIADASRQVTLPFSRLWPDGKSDSEDMLGIEVAPLQNWLENSKQTLERFAHMQSDAREERYIATGNLLAAYDWLSRKGRIIHYTDDKGNIHQGILTSRDFDLAKHAVEKGRQVNDPAEIKQWLDTNAGKPIWAKENVVRITKDRYGGYVIATDKSKKTGGVFYLDKDLTNITGDFYSRGGAMQNEIGEAKIIPAIKRLQALGAQFMAEASAPKTTKVEQPSGPAAHSAFQRPPAKPAWYYSAVGRAIDNAKQAKATPEQWLGMLKNTPGVKPEEMQWLDLDNWLKEHKGPVGKAELADYVRANSLEVREIAKANNPITPENRERMAQHLFKQPFEKLPSEDKQRVDQAIRDNDFGAAKFAGYVLPGGENYRELLLTLPQQTTPLTYPEPLTALPEGYDVIQDSHQPVGRQYGITPPGQVHAAPLGLRRYETREAAKAGELQILNETRNEAAAKAWRDANEGTQFKSSHWDEPNVLAHIRFNDRVVTEPGFVVQNTHSGNKSSVFDTREQAETFQRTLPQATRDGTRIISNPASKKTLFVEEIQSDWHQKGKREGYAIAQKRSPYFEIRDEGGEIVAARSTHAAAEQFIRDTNGKIAPWSGEPLDTSQWWIAKKELIEKQSGVPDAPFKTTWPELAMKRIIKYAVDNGYDKVAWTPGEVQAARYDLGQHVDQLIYNKKTHVLEATKGDPPVSVLAGDEGNGIKVAPEKLADYIGKDAAEKILNNPTRVRQVYPDENILEGEDLRVGGAGMRGFYDDILPKTVNKLVKKYGAKVGQGAVPTAEPPSQPTGEGGAPNGWGVADNSTRKPAPPTVLAHFLDITPALREAAKSEGFPLFKAQPGEVAPPQPSDAVHAALTGIADRLKLARDLEAIVQHFVGKHVRLRFSDTIPMEPGENVAAWGNVSEGTNFYGSYLPLDGIIELALADPTATDQYSTAAHEAFHAAEDQLLNDKEMALLQREDGRLRDVVARYFNMPRSRIDTMADFEVRAVAFEAYLRDRAAGGHGSGFHIGIRSIFERLMRLFRQIANYLRGLGYRSAHDVFSDIYAGKMAERPSRTQDEGLPSRIAEKLAEGEPRPELEAARGPAARRMNVGAMFSGVRNGRIRDLVANALESKFGRKFVEGVQDLSHPVRRLQDELEARREEPFTDLGDFYTRKRLYPGRVGNEVRDFNKNYLDPMIDYMKKNAISLEQGGDYVYAKHVAERNARLGALYPQNHPFNQALHDPTIVGASGRSQEWADNIMREVERSGKKAQYEKVAEYIQAIRHYILDRMVKGSLISEQTADNWRQQYQNYVDLRGFEDAPEEAPEDYREPARFQVRGKEIKQAFGRKSKADNPIVNMLDQAYRAIDRAERNRYLHAVWNALGRMNAENPGSISDIVKLDKGAPKKVIDRNTGMVKTIDDSSYALSPNTATTKIGGRPHHMVFKNRDLAEAVKRMSPDALNGFFGALLRAENKIKALWTHYAPDFLFRHFMFRYPIEGALNSFEQKEGGAHSVAEYVKQGFPFFGRASKAIFAANKGEASSDPEIAEMQRYWKEMGKAGGAMMFRQSRDMDLVREHLQTQLMSIKGGPVSTAREKWRRGVEAMDTVTNALDNALRLSAYASARKQGKSPQQAALIAREATVDFQQKGKWSNTIGLWFPFGNVAIQTSARMIKAVGRSAIMRRTFMGTVLAGVLAGAFNYLIGGNDKDGVPFFEKIPEWDRRLNFIVLNPYDRDEKGRPIPIKIPMPYNWAFPLMLGYGFANMMFGTKGVLNTVGTIVRAGVEALTPFGQAENIPATLVPELGRPVAYLASNRDAFNRQVHTNPDYQHGPNAESGKRDIGGRVRTGEGWKYIASAVNKASGGSRVKSGYLDFYPEDYREIFNYVAGSQSRLAQNVYQSGKSVAQGQMPAATTMPLERVIRGTDYDAADRSLLYQRHFDQKHPWLR